jgi:hypothetical protein
LGSPIKTLTVAVLEYEVLEVLKNDVKI